MASRLRPLHLGQTTLVKLCDLPMNIEQSRLVIAAATGALIHFDLDAGTGSMILQLLIGGFAGVLIVGKLYWERLKSLFVRRRPIPDELVTANESESTAEPVTDGSQTG